MIPAQELVLFNVVPPGAIVDNAAVTANVIDTLGYDYVTVVVQYGAMDIASTVLKIQESDVKASSTTLTSGADVTGLVWGTSTNLAGTTSTLPAATDDNKFFRFDVDTKARKRYLLLALTCGDGSAGTYVSAFAILSKAEQPPTTASGLGCAEILRI